MAAPQEKTNTLDVKEINKTDIYAICEICRVVSLFASEPIAKLAVQLHRGGKHPKDKGEQVFAIGGLYIQTFLSSVVDGYLLVENKFFSNRH